jgi:uncharacterized protein
MYVRTLSPPRGSFFLFGPRGTGKSTWLRDEFRPDLRIDLLNSREFLSLQADPSVLRQRLEALPEKAKIVIDEIQKIPQLLDEVHSLMFDHPSYRFALTGSSARKLKKAQSNLLAGRAVQRRFFSLTSQELGADFDISEILKFGSLPNSINLKRTDDKKDYLLSYVDTYLKEEVQAEAAVRNIPSYHRFLKHAAIMNGQVVNLNNISREAAVKRATLDGYFSIVEETLLGDFLEPIHLHAKVKEVSTPKFYFFDCGVVRALRNELDESLGSEKGFLLETFIFNELRAYSSYHQKNWEFFYWGVPSGGEVDFIVVQGKRKIAIEVKASSSWKNEYQKTMVELLDAKKVERAYGVYQGATHLKKEGVDVLSLEAFCRRLHAGELFD